MNNIKGKEDALLATIFPLGKPKTSDFTGTFCQKFEENTGPKEVAQWIRARTTLPEEYLQGIPSTYKGTHILR